MFISVLISRVKLLHGANVRRLSQIRQHKRDAPDCPAYFRLSDTFTENQQLAVDLVNTMVLHENFLTAEEETSILNEIEPYLETMHYEFDHWDDAIHGYRETERSHWNEQNDSILNRVRELAFPPGVPQLRHVHVLDLSEKGVIKPHIDAVRFCGNTIAGLSLLTDSVMRLVNDKNKQLVADVLLKRRSLYIMKGTARYDYTHEILSNEHSKFAGIQVFKHRRISVICRNEPEPKQV